MGLFGVLVPGPQWWRTTRKRAAQVMAGSCVAFILSFLTVAIIGKSASPPPRTTSPPPVVSQAPQTIPKPVPPKAPVVPPGKPVTKKAPPAGSFLKLITHRYGPYLTVQVKTDLPQKTHAYITVERFFYKKGSSTASFVEYFNAFHPMWLLRHPQPVHLNNAQWKHDVHAAQEEIAEFTGDAVQQIDRIEDNIVVSAFVPQRKDLSQEVSIPYAITEDPTLPLVLPDPASILADATYRREIQQHVIRACYRTLLSRKALLMSPTEGLTVDTMIRDMKRDGRYVVVQNLEDEAVGVVAGLPHDVRMAIYAKFNLRCQAGGIKSESAAP